MPSSPPPFPERLLTWWDRHGRKDLPWQRPRSMYRVWVSEIMLQQTQVGTVVPYFERWMARFPGLPALAAAPLDEVLSLWSGLGYYARARNLHAAARICAERHGGALPESEEGLRALPGIGPSTANAILSQALDRPAVVLDGNVRRMLARHAAVEGWPGHSGVQRRLWREAEFRLPASRGADYTQAVMDLGSLVCTRREPRCGECPVSADCLAFGRGAVERYPESKPKRRIGQRSLHMLIVRDGNGRVLLEKRPPSGIWGGLWSLPEGDSPAEILEQLGIENGAAAPAVNSLPDREHRLTHLRMQIKPALMTAPALPALQCRELKETAQRAWFDESGWAKLGLPRPVKDLLEAYT